jgi:hypothetical protein
MESENSSETSTHIRHIAEAWTIHYHYYDNNKSHIIKIKDIVDPLHNTNVYRAYTKEWCGFNRYSLLIPHHSFVYALYRGQTGIAPLMLKLDIARR